MALHITDKDFKEQTSEGLVFVDFFAEWCGPCKMLAPVIDELAEKYEGKIKVAKLDIDENRQTATEFNVMSIPTMILFKDGEPVEKISGFQPKQALEKYLDSKI
ncbi:thioredoxin [Erysipelothrix rhusiopathiae]|uniref:Thioredoxin n=2 Tax=Erysipelothrix TaxID=1647 RepID=E7FXH4_ERYRH|nr:MULTISPECIES: thioredoxin [Erysipelothrix]UPU39891.1 thioredoxin [Erysipelothrix sp. Poltava]CAH2761417.1 thioredoxin [Erysipelothrix sp. A18Y020d]AGN25377.1 thioredoxin [Erysipelothrix rhusiopathiae SY1027]AMS11613.1 thiol reductase thioredoxin [Erysipelothrix rhusiopathiae]AOO68112.1 thioredoxin [Erysipelothrix rhusiopathiae]